MSFTIRRPTLSDVDAVVALSKSLGNRWPEQPEPWKAGARDESRYCTHAVAVSPDGSLVGYGTLRPDLPAQPTAGKFRLELGVAPEFRRRGIGTELYKRVLIDLKGLGGTVVRARMDNEPPGATGFLTKHGFTRYFQMLHMEQEVSTLPDPIPAPVLPEGFTITTLAAEGHSEPVLQQIYAARNQCFADIPSVDPFVAPTFESFLKEMHDPLLLPDCFFIAKHGEQYIGLSYAARYVDDATKLGHRSTGILREYRRLGLATAMKWRVSEYARANAYRCITTATAHVNTGMRAANIAMGFQVKFTQNRYERSFS